MTLAVLSVPRSGLVPITAGIQIPVVWTTKIRPVACKALIDSVVVYYPDLLSALRFACAAHVHVGEAYAILDQVSSLPAGLTVGIAEGSVESFVTITTSEITGDSVGRADEEGRRGILTHRREINIEQGIVDRKIRDLEAWGLGATLARDESYLNARGKHLSQPELRHETESIQSWNNNARLDGPTGHSQFISRLAVAGPRRSPDLTIKGLHLTPC